MSPYVITTRQALAPGLAEDGSGPQPFLSQRAVATLEEARDLVRHAYHPFDHPDGRDVNQRCKFLDGTAGHRTPTTGLRGIGESGGSALLPDGTVIEVEQVDIREIAYRADFRWQTRRASDVAPEIIDAYNARWVA